MQNSVQKVHCIHCSQAAGRRLGIYIHTNTKTGHSLMESNDRSQDIAAVGLNSKSVWYNCTCFHERKLLMCAVLEQ